MMPLIFFKAQKLNKCEEYKMLPEKKYHVDLEKAINQNADMIYRIAVTITGNQADAEDVFQETFLRLVKHQDKIQSEEHLKAWLVRVANNCAKTMVTNSWNKKTQGLTEEVEEKGQEKESRLPSVMAELQKLPPKYSLVLYLFYYEDYSVKEISILLGKKENSVKTLLSRGRRLLRQRLEEGGYQNE